MSNAKNKTKKNKKSGGEGGSNRRKRHRYNFKKAVARAPVRKKKKTNGIKTDDRINYREKSY